jgi:hypothetical protein
VPAQSNTWNVFARSDAGIVGSDPTQGMDVCVRLSCVCVVLCVGSGLARGWSPFQGVLPTVQKDYDTEEEATAQQTAVKPLMNEWMNELLVFNKKFHMYFPLPYVVH